MWCARKSRLSYEALDRLRLRYRIAVFTAEAYRAAGFTTVLQDIVIGPMLDEFVAMIPHRPFSLMVLTPDSAAVAEREQQRTKTGYVGFTTRRPRLDPPSTPKLGFWLDSTNLTVDQTVELALSETDSAARIDQARPE